MLTVAELPAVFPSYVTVPPTGSVRATSLFWGFRKSYEKRCDKRFDLVRPPPLGFAAGFLLHSPSVFFW